MTSSKNESSEVGNAAHSGASSSTSNPPLSKDAFREAVIVEELASGKSQERAAKKAGISARHLRRILGGDEDLAIRIETRRREIFDALQQNSYHVVTEAMPRALKVCVDLMDHEDPSIRLRAVSFLASYEARVRDVQVDQRLRKLETAVQRAQVRGQGKWTLGSRTD